jgi:hypothetical protein
MKVGYSLLIDEYVDVSAVEQSDLVSLRVAALRVRRR